MICPFLGISDDRKTSLAFPSTWNCCHRCKPVVAVALVHQKNICLTGDYEACPVFLQAPNGALPRDLRHVNLARSAKNKAFPKIVLLTLVLLAVMLLGWNPLIRSVPLFKSVFPETSSSATPTQSVLPTVLPASITPSPEKFTGLAPFTPFPLQTPDLNSASYVTPIITRKPRSISEWIGTNYIFMIYRVQQGWSLERLATHYNTTVAALMEVNYKLHTPLYPKQLIVIPINQVDVSGLPQFEAYRVPENMSIEDLAAQLQVDPAQLQYFNGFGENDQLVAKEWIIIPREKTK